MEKLVYILGSATLGTYLYKRFSRKQLTPEEMGAVKEQVLKLIKEKPIFVASKSYCPYCQATLRTFDSLKVEPYVLQLNEIDEGSEIQSILREITGQSTVPNIFIGGKHIGGNDDLQSLKTAGKLDALLSKL